MEAIKMRFDTVDSDAAMTRSSKFIFVVRRRMRQPERCYRKHGRTARNHRKLDAEIDASNVLLMVAFVVFFDVDEVSIEALKRPVLRVSIIGSTWATGLF